VFVDADVVEGDRCKLENYVNAHRGAVVEDEVFLGPGAVLTNDRWPRATNRDGSVKGAEDWTCEGVTVRRRASASAGVVVLSGATVGAAAMVGAGAVVTRDVEAGAIVVGNLARRVGSAPDA